MAPPKSRRASAASSSSASAPGATAEQRPACPRRGRPDADARHAGQVRDLAPRGLPASAEAFGWGEDRLGSGGATGDRGPGEQVDALESLRRASAAPGARARRWRRREERIGRTARAIRLTRSPGQSESPWGVRSAAPSADEHGRGGRSRLVARISTSITSPSTSTLSDSSARSTPPARRRPCRSGTGRNRPQTSTIRVDADAQPRRSQPRAPRRRARSRAGGSRRRRGTSARRRSSR